MPDAFDITQEVIDSGRAWYVGYGCDFSLYITESREDAQRFADHLNSFPGSRYSVNVRSQADIDEHKNKTKNKNKEA